MTIGGPSSNETFPLMERTKFYVLRLAALAATQHIYDLYYAARALFLRMMVLILDIYDRSSVALALQLSASE